MKLSQPLPTFERAAVSQNRMKIVPLQVRQPPAATMNLNACNYSPTKIDSNPAPFRMIDQPKIVKCTNAKQDKTDAK